MPTKQGLMRGANAASVVTTTGTVCTCTVQVRREPGLDEQSRIPPVLPDLAGMPCSDAPNSQVAGRLRYRWRDSVKRSRLAETRDRGRGRGPPLDLPCCSPVARVLAAYHQTTAVLPLPKDRSSRPPLHCTCRNKPPRTQEQGASDVCA